MKILVKWETYHGGDEGSEAQEMEIEQVEKDTAEKVIDRFFKAVEVDEAERERLIKGITISAKIDESEMKRLHDEAMNAPVTVFDDDDSDIRILYRDEDALDAFESIVDRYPDLKGVQGTLSEAVAEVKKKIADDIEEKAQRYAAEVRAIHEEGGLDLDEAARRIADWKREVDAFEEEKRIPGAYEIMQKNIEKQTKKERGEK